MKEFVVDGRGIGILDQNHGLNLKLPLSLRQKVEAKLLLQIYSQKIEKAISEHFMNGEMKIKKRVLCLSFEFQEK